MNTTHPKALSPDAARRRSLELLILKHPPVVNIPGSAGIVEGSGTPDQLEDSLSGPEPEFHPSDKFKYEPFRIIGPLTPQSLELSSSSASTGGTRTTSGSSRTSSNLFRSASTSCLPDHPRTPSPITLPAEEEPEIVSTGEVDWVEYSRPDIGLEDEISEWSGDSWSINTGGRRVIFLEDDKQEEKVARKVVNRDVIAEILSRCLIQPRSPPSISAIRYAERHVRSTQIYGSPTSSPTDQRLQLRTAMKRGLSTVKEVADETPDDTESETSHATTACCACGRKSCGGKKMRMLPCRHATCSTCFSSALSAVTVTHGNAKCPGCIEDVTSFEVYKKLVRNEVTPHDIVEEEVERITAPTGETTLIGNAEVFVPATKSSGKIAETVVLRIDNVAWDITPEAVEGFLPRNTLAADHPQPIHILLDRFDGRTKDYMYIEAASPEAGRKILKHRQNQLMPGGALTGGRKRPVTITMVTHAELLAELRPRGKQELPSLLALCQAAVSSPISSHNSVHSGSYVAPNGVAHFVKSRHGPFMALMSIMSKVKGPKSPIYWDLFGVVSGAITALANAILHSSDSANRHYYTDSSQYNYDTPVQDPQDAIVLDKLTSLFKKTYTFAESGDKAKQQLE